MYKYDILKQLRRHVKMLLHTGVYIFTFMYDTIIVTKKNVFTQNYTPTSKTTIRLFLKNKNE